MSNNDIRIVDAPPQVRLGDLLLQQRSQLGLDLDAIAAALRIRPHYLRALENGAYGELPGTTHGKGFLRSYAGYLGLTGELDRLQQLYQRETAGEAAPALALPQPLPEGKLPTARVIAGALLAAVLLYLVWYSWQEPARPAVVAPPPLAPGVVAPPAAEPVVEPAPAVEATAAAPETVPAPVAEELPPAPAEKPPVVETPKPPPALTPAPVAAPVAGSPVVRAISPAWIQVQDQMGATIYSRLLQAGQEYQPPALPGLKLTTGNGAGIVIIKNGVAGKALGRPAEVVRNINLSPLPAGHVAPRAPAAEPVPTVTRAPAPAVIPGPPPSKTPVRESSPYDYDGSGR